MHLSRFESRAWAFHAMRRRQVRAELSDSGTSQPDYKGLKATQAWPLLDAGIEMRLSRCVWGDSYELDFTFEGNVEELRDITERPQYRRKCEEDLGDCHVIESGEWIICLSKSKRWNDEVVPKLK